MHPAAMEWVRAVVEAQGPFTRVCEVGSLDINGSVRSLFAGVKDYIGVDIQEGPGVDVVGDFIDLGYEDQCDCVVSTEALEHHPDPGAIIKAVHHALVERGLFIVTAAGPGRAPHSGRIEGPVQEGEHYRNIEPQELSLWFEMGGWSEFRVDVEGRDVRAWAVK